MGKVIVSGAGRAKEPSSGLPSGYSELVYIQSNGSQYIDTKFVPNQDTRVVIDLEYQANSGTSSIYPCGARISNTSGQFAIRTVESKYYARYGTQDVVVLNGAVSGRYIIDMNKNVFAVNGTALTLTKETFSSNVSFQLFALNNNGSGGYGIASGMKLYACQIYDNGTLVRDLVPCLSDSEGVGLYDLVNQKFYGNAGSGSFIGSEV